MSDKQRAEFESKFAEPWALENEVGKWKDIEGNYIYSQLDIAWQAWQAAIASLVVEIPSFSSDRYETDIIYSDDMEKALDEAGIRYE